MSGLRSLSVVVPVLVLTACQGGTEPTVELSPAEAGDVVEVLVTEGLPTWNRVPAVLGSG